MIRLSLLLLILTISPVSPAEGRPVRLSGEIVDDTTGKGLASRLYIQDEKGEWHFPMTDHKAGSAVYYRKQRPNTNSVEMHTTLSAHPFTVDLPPGKYTITIEHGKEYRAETRRVTVGNDPVKVTIRLKRWIDTAKLGWYSGETHVHRPVEDLPNVMLAENLNVALPLTSWVTEGFTAPKAIPGEAKLIKVDDTHVIWPRNTEYEIFTLNKKPHTLGAFFVLNHRNVFEKGVPPVAPVGEQARKEGGLIEMDKHNWPWSMALVPVLKPDLYELANNHVWRTEFGFPAFGESAADYMKVERDRHGFTERGWIEFGFQNYYALLNCGFRLRPTAGTASGVHPVPLGYGRVYVHCPDGFSYEKWMKGLKDGRSFVTTGPMLFAEVNDKPPGFTFVQDPGTTAEYEVTARAMSDKPLRVIEIVKNGEVHESFQPENRRVEAGAYLSEIRLSLKVGHDSWIAVRCYEESRDRVKFAHSGPVFINVPLWPLRPRKAEIKYLIRRVEDQIERSKDVLPAEAMKEYEKALEVYRTIARTAR